MFDAPRMDVGQLNFNASATTYRRLLSDHQLCCFRDSLTQHTERGGNSLPTSHFTISSECCQHPVRYTHARARAHHTRLHKTRVCTRAHGLLMRTCTHASTRAHARTHACTRALALHAHKFIFYIVSHNCQCDTVCPVSLKQRVLIVLAVSSLSIILTYC